MPGSIDLAEYLFTRLRQLGLGAVHGVPGDYNLQLIDFVEPSGLTWVGSANELNAGYAADGYARVKGIGAVLTTFGVGELSAINAIAGAYTELAPVVHIVGTPRRESRDSRLLIHHTFNDGDYGRFAKMHAEVTHAQAHLRDPRSSAQQIDEVLQQCLLSSRPVYIDIPLDMVTTPVSRARLDTPIEIPEPEFNPAEDEVVRQIAQRITACRQPVILVDGESKSLGIVDAVQRLASSSGWPTWTAPFGKGLLDETPASFHGVFNGSFHDDATREYIEHADVILNFGPHYSSTNSSHYTAIPRVDATIAFTTLGVKIAKDTFRDVSSKRILERVLQEVDFAKIQITSAHESLSRDSLLDIQAEDSPNQITQDRVWRYLGKIVRSGDILMGETGTAGYGCRSIPLPPRTIFFSPVTWLSIGYMLPAAQGASLAQRELARESKYFGIEDARTILFIGDGSFQMTAQELATIIKHKLDVTIFLINNDGYTIERCIHGRKQVYNDISFWRYLLAPEFFGADKDTYTASAKTWGELQDAINHPSFVERKGLKMVEVCLGRDDSPPGLLSHLMKTQIDRDGM
ncbi:uncharacterized protein E0L32_001086 [Thyridium curvatum]|uniref:Pyruvate decarboxylase n=1 Tax=Thyridium curvatum TaxID=1093900 RepID=A0A507B2Y1_9PEZI|nr:uncharacterized protein E0L32_001086 [Thyridium curvatum]TPX11268.1 hypothetical protein E0L32_001086 [Thyridium curvatum]